MSQSASPPVATVFTQNTVSQLQNQKLGPVAQPDLRWNKELEIDVPKFEITSVVPVPPIININEYRYMHDPLESKRRALNERLWKCGQALRAHYGLNEFSKLSDVAQDERDYLAVVRTCAATGPNSCQCTVDGPWSAELGGYGANVTLQLNDIPAYTLFPGKIIALRGKNLGGSQQADDSGHTILVSKLFELPPLPLRSSLPTTSSSSSSSTSPMDVDPEETHGGPVRVMVCSGPYAANTMRTMQMLEELLSFAFRQRNASVVVFAGPFVSVPDDDEENGQDPAPAGEEMMYDDQFDLITERLTAALARRVGLKVVLVPSLRDAAAEYVYPQPPFDVLFDSDDVIGVTNPAVLSLNGSTGPTVGISTNDILQHLSPNMVEIGNQNSTLGRIPRIAAQVIQSRSFYPMVPPSPDALLDFSHQKYFQFAESTPDIVILPSVFPAFAQKIGDTLVINPSFVSKRTFAEITIAPPFAPSQPSKSAVVADRTVVQFFRLPMPPPPTAV